MTIDKPLEQLAEYDLTQLIGNAVMEGKRIEYKREFNLDPKPGQRNADKEDGKRKFLDSIASFANASGGDLIVGIQAVDGKPGKIVPLESFDSDATKLRLESLIRTHIDPKVFGVEFREIPVVGGHAFVIRIPKTYVGVHMVTFNDENRFWARGANGRVLMDVAEIKAAFTLSESITEKVRRWRMERIAAILADETPRVLTSPSRIVFHVMPVCAFDGRFKANLAPLLVERKNLTPINEVYGNVTLGFDGILSCSDYTGRGEINSYTHVFRNGCVEGADAHQLTEWNSQGKKIYGEINEGKLIRFLDRVVLLLGQIGSAPPLVLGLSLLNVKDFTMAVDHRFTNHSQIPINKDHLLLPEVFVDSLKFDSSEVLRESFYMIWNACNWPRSLSYDASDKWNPK